MESESLKLNWKQYAAGLFPTGMYFFDAGMDTASCVDFCTDGQTWWCVISAGFIIVPEILVSAYISYKIWRDRQKTKEDAKTEDFAILSSITNTKVKSIVSVLFFLFVPTMVLPFVMLPWLSYKALQDEKATDDGAKRIRKAQLTMIQLKGMETLLQTCPQLSLKSYIVIHKLHCNKGIYNGTLSNMTTMEGNLMTTMDGNFQHFEEYCEDMWSMDPASREVGALDILSPFGSLCSLCFSIACFVVDENSDDWYRKIVWFIALLGSIGSRMMVCGVLASWNQALWLVPPITACAIVLVLKTLRFKYQGKRFSSKKDFQVKEGESPFPRVALMVVVEQGLLLSYPSPEGILACASYIGFAIWFYVYGLLIDGATDIELGVEALSTCIMGQGMSLLLTFIARRLPYETPNLLPKSTNKETIDQPETANNDLSESTKNPEGTIA